MLRGLIGFIVGAGCGVFTFASFMMEGAEAASVWIAIDIISLAALLIWCHKHHIKMRDKYHDKIRGGSKRYE